MARNNTPEFATPEVREAAAALQPLVTETEHVIAGLATQACQVLERLPGVDDATPTYARPAHKSFFEPTTLTHTVDPVRPVSVEGFTNLAVEAAVVSSERREHWSAYAEMAVPLPRMPGYERVAGIRIGGLLAPFGMSTRGAVNAPDCQSRVAVFRKPEALQRNYAYTYTNALGAAGLIAASVNSGFAPEGTVLDTSKAAALFNDWSLTLPVESLHPADGTPFWARTHIPGLQGK